MKRILAIALLAACTASAATPTRPPIVRAARASFYGEEYRGRPMAWKGLPFDPGALTCASWFYPFGTVLEVRSGGRTVHVAVTDRGPAWELVRQGIVLDLSERAFALLSPDRTHPLRPGPIPVSLRVISRP